MDLVDFPMSHPMSPPVMNSMGEAIADIMDDEMVWMLPYHIVDFVDCVCVPAAVFVLCCVLLVVVAKPKKSYLNFDRLSIKLWN